MLETVKIITGVPGGGKSSLLADYAVRFADADWDAFLMCFNKDAANSLRSKIPARSMMPGSITPRTIHSFAYEAAQCYPDMIIDDGDIKKFMQTLGYDYRAGSDDDDWRFNDLPTGNVLLTAVTTLVNSPPGPTSATRVEEDLYAANAPFSIAAVIDFGREYAQYKRRLGKYDFDDLLAVATHEGFERYAGQRVALLVDEMQDITYLQLQVIRSFIESAQARKVLFVGDPLQRIYEYRGTVDLPTLAVEFKDTSIIREHHEQSYRLNRAVARTCAQFAYKNIFAVSIKERPNNATQGNVARDFEMSAYLPQVLPSLERGSMAILARTNKQVAALAAECVTYCIPHRILGRQHTPIYSLRGYKACYALRKLTLHENPHERHASTLHALWNQSFASPLHADRIAQVTAEDYKRLCITAGMSPAALQYTVKLCTATEEYFKRYATGGVVLTTIHRAKGLEFDEVWVLNSFPCRHLAPQRTRDLEQEEACVMYVALSRAKERLRIFDELHLEGVAPEDGYESRWVI